MYCPSLFSSAIITNSVWKKWSGQLGFDMSLQNPYGANLSHVFPNSKTLGVNLGLGKWLTPDLGLRVGFNWQNDIIRNNNLHWLDQDGHGS